MLKRISIIGCGRIFDKHVRAIKSNSKFFILDSICDVSLKKAKTASKIYNVPYYQNMIEMLKVRKPDLTVILTESGNHLKHLNFASKFCNNFIIEKPLCLNNQHLKIVNKLKKKKRIFVVNQNRFNSPIVLLKKIIQKKKLGKIFMISANILWRRDSDYYNLASWRGTRKLDGGVIGNQSAHFLDMLLWLNGDIIEVKSFKKKINKKIEAADTTVACFNFKNGSLGTIQATTATAPKDIEGSILIAGSKGTVKIGGFAMNRVEIFQVKDFNFSKALKNINYEPSSVYGYGHKSFYKHIHQIYNNKKKINQELSLAIKTVQLINKFNI